MTKRGRSELQLFACALWLCGAGCVGTGPDASGTESAEHHGDYGKDAGQAAAGSGGGGVGSADADGGSDDEDADAGTDEHHHHQHHPKHHHKPWCRSWGGGSLGHHGGHDGDPGDGDDPGGWLGR